MLYILLQMYFQAMLTTRIQRDGQEMCFHSISFLYDKYNLSVSNYDIENIV